MANPLPMDRSTVPYGPQRSTSLRTTVLIFDIGVLVLVHFTLLAQNESNAHTTHIFQFAASGKPVTLSSTTTSTSSGQRKTVLVVENQYFKVLQRLRNNNMSLSPFLVLRFCVMPAGS